MFPIGNWLLSVKSAPSPPPKKGFDLFWEAMGKFVKKSFLFIQIAIILLVGYWLGTSQGNLSTALSNFPVLSWFTGGSAAVPVSSIPGEKLYAIVVGSVATQAEARDLAHRLRAGNIVASYFFANNRYVVYIGNLKTRAQAESALLKVRSRGFPAARILP